VDDPQDGRRPSAESISPLELFANQVAHSIEERKLDQEVRKSTERYRTLVETMHEGVFSVDLRERILLANASFSHLLGVSELLLNGRSIGSIMSQDDLVRFRSETALHEGGRVARFELTLRSGSGESIPVQVSASPFMEEDEHRGCFAVVRDLRAEKKVEEERRIMQDQLAQAEKLSALGEMISGIAHELNNPLTGVMGFSQLLMNSDASDAVKESVVKIHRDATRCQKIVQNLLDFSRRRDSAENPVDVNELVEATLELRATQLKVDGIEVVKDLEQGLPVIVGDFHKLQQVLFNIVNNAHQAMNEIGQGGRLLLRTQRKADWVEISCADTGPGIPQDRIQKIFDPFFTTKGIGKGTGLGLSLSYGIIQKHQGRIEVTSAAGGGATFMIRLPVPDAAPERAEQIAQAPGRRAPLEGKAILVVDDEETIVDLLESVLLQAGHRVTTACNGRQALEKIRASDYDVIISDLRMPDMGGQKLYECVSEIKPHLKDRMIFSTGDTVNPTTQALFQRTGNLHIAKPFRLEEVDEVIRQVIELTSGRGGGSTEGRPAG
jgi:two-component system NtrC family sensor kinase